MNTDISFNGNSLLNCEFDKQNALKVKELMKQYPKHYHKVLQHQYPEIMQWIFDKTPLLVDDKNFQYRTGIRVYWIFKGFTDFPKCPVCGNRIGYRQNTALKKEGWQRHCSIACGSLDLNTQAKNKATNREKYGCDWPQQNKDVMQKSIASTIKHYGVERPTQAKSVIDKIKHTCIKKYGVSNVFATGWCKNKIQQSMEKRYGVKHAMDCHEFFKKAQKKYFYNGMYFASGPELAYYIWLVDNNIMFKYQPNAKFEYRYAGKIHMYNPDFFLIDNKQYIEIKGDFYFENSNTSGRMWYPYRKSKTKEQLRYLDGLARAKQKCMFDNNVKIITSNQYQIYLKYIRENYGKEYISQFRK